VGGGDQLQQLCFEMHRLQLAARSMQPVTALQQLTALVLTSCDYSTTKELLALPVDGIAALSCLEVLETTFCEPFAAAGARLCI
jgi:hypothetical protein